MRTRFEQLVLSGLTLVCAGCWNDSGAGPGAPEGKGSRIPSFRLELRNAKSKLACQPRPLANWRKMESAGWEYYGFIQRAGSACRFSIDVPPESVLSLQTWQLSGDAPAEQRIVQRISGVEHELLPARQEATRAAASADALELQLESGPSVIEFLVPRRSKPTGKPSAVAWADVALESQSAMPYSDRLPWTAPVSRVPFPDMASLRERTDTPPSTNTRSQRLLIVGLDGASWNNLDPLLERGLMPVLAALRERSSWGDLASTIVPESAMAWTSMHTGVNPGIHGVYHFLSGRARRASYWKLLGEAGIPSIVMAVPGANLGGFDGLQIAGWETSKSEPYTHPAELKPILDQVGYDPGLEIARNADYFEDRISKRTEVATKLLAQPGWRHAFVVFEYSDTVGHHFGLGSEEFVDIHRALDRALGALVAAAGPDTTLMIVSDHGWRSFRATVDLNAWLRTHGYAPWSVQLWSGNVVGIGVDRAALRSATDAEVPDGMLEALISLVDPSDGKPVIAKIEPASSYFAGPAARRSPARFIVELRSDLQGAPATSNPLFFRERAGDHHRSEGIYLLKGPGIPARRGEARSVYDVVPTVLAFFGVAAPGDLTGTPILESGIAEPNAAPNAMPRLIDPGEAEPDEAEPGAAEPRRDREIETLRERLRSLGYIE